LCRGHVEAGMGALCVAGGSGRLERKERIPAPKEEGEEVDDWVDGKRTRVVGEGERWDGMLWFVEVDERGTGRW
jgi:hypothetical protein